MDTAATAPATAVQLTPVQRFGAARGDAWFCKREDAAGFVSQDMPSGAKVRAYAAMVAAAPGQPLVVGCSADGLMQVYVAAAAQQYGRRAHVCVPRRKVPSVETLWAIAHGAEVQEVAPGYPSQYRGGARAWAQAQGGAVRWHPLAALQDTAAQVANLPAAAKRVVVPCGTGAIAAGVLAGLAMHSRSLPVLAVAVSAKAAEDEILAMATRACPCMALPPFRLVRAPGEYGRKVQAALPDGTELDPAYAAKALPYVEAGDVLWNTGRRGDLRYVPPEVQ